MTTQPTGERYTREGRIATGGMGEVWRAHDNLLGREVAVKVLRPEYASDPTFRVRFAAEARHAAGLYHPGIASVLDYGELADPDGPDGGGTPYLVMELVEGRPLSDLLAVGRRFDPEQARVLVLQAAEALATAHAAGVVHRDVKPGNLLVTPDGQVKITDFGIARAADSVPVTRTGQIVGTPHYLSPEQAGGHAASAASDVYALGVVLFECLAGRRPFQGDTPVAVALAHLQQPVPELPPSVPDGLRAVVRRALAKDPAERYPDGAALAQALREAPSVPAGAVPLEGDTRGLRVPAGPLGAAAPARWPLYAAGAIVVLLLAVLLIERPWAGGGPGPASTAPTPTPGASAATATVAVPRVRVARSAYVGRPVVEVQRALAALGLRTTVTLLANDGTHQPGIVADLAPTGRVRRGSIVTLRVWGAPPPVVTTPPPAPGEDHGREGGGRHGHGSGAGGGGAKGSAKGGGKGGHGGGSKGGPGKGAKGD